MLGKSWRDKLNQSLATVNESSQRLKQQVQQAVQQAPTGASVFAAVTAGDGGGEAPQPPPQQQQQQNGAEPQQYLRLPVESAKRLRWFDRQDLSLLMQVHLREKQELFEANNALRQVLRRRGVTDAAVDADLYAINSQVDAMRAQEEGVNQVLALAAQAEVEHLRESLDSAQHELQHMRRQRLQAASSGTLPAAAAPQHQQHQQQQQQPAGVAGAERVALQLLCSGEDAAVIINVVNDEGLTAGGPNSSSSSSLRPSPALSDALAGLVQAVATGGSSSSAGSAADPQLLQQAAAAMAQLAAAQGVRLPALLPAARPPAAGAAGEEAGLPATEGGEAISEGPAWQQQCVTLQLQVNRLQSELAQAEQDAAFSRDATERRAQEMRSRLAESQQRQGELLRMAQDSRLEAESRCEAAERQLQQAEDRAVRLEGEVKELKAAVRQAQQEVKQRDACVAAAETRVAAAEAAVQRARGSADTDAKSAEAMQQARARISELEAAAAAGGRQLAAARQQQAALEARLAGAEQAAARAAQEVHEMEEAVHDRDALAARLSMLEARLDESRVERGQAESYRTLVQQSEEKRARAEDELVSTAKLAASLEARLAATVRENNALQLEVQSAAARVNQAEQSVARLVQERWQAVAADRTQWPLAAQEEIENVEARLAAMLSSLKEAQAQLREALASVEVHRTARAAAERAAAAAQDRAERQQRESEQRLQRLEAAASAASVQMAEFRKALSDVERERDQLAADKAEREAAARHAAAAVAGARRRTGSGALSADEGAALSRALAAGGAPPLSPRDLVLQASSVAGSPLPGMKHTLETTDLLYLKNVMLKFIDAHLSGRSQECEVLLPAVATLLRASPAEYHVLRAHIKSGGSSSWLPTLIG